MKVIKTKDQKRSTPVDISSIMVDPNDCFGNEWENTDPSCVKCSSYETCMVLVLSKNSKKKDTIKTGKHFFDELDWEKVPWEDLLALIKATPKQFSLTQLKDTVKETSKCIDNVTVHSKVQNWLIENNIKLSNGCLY